LINLKDRSNKINKQLNGCKLLKQKVTNKYLNKILNKIHKIK